MITSDRPLGSARDLEDQIHREIMPLFKAAIEGAPAFYRNPNVRKCWEAIDDDPCRCLAASEGQDENGYLQDVTLLEQFSGEAPRPYEACQRCPVYAEICPSVVEELGEAFNTLIHILGEKDAAIGGAAQLTRCVAGRAVEGIVSRKHLGDRRLDLRR